MTGSNVSNATGGNVSAGTKIPAKAWGCLAVTYLASITAPLAQFKIPPLASWIIPTFGMDGATFGYLMSALAIIGVILAFPAAFICRKLGLKTVMLISVACVFLGSLMSYFAADVAVLMVSRMLEGVGIGLVGVAAPTCVTVWFPENRRGLALGIWTTWVPVSIVLMFNLAPSIAGMYGFRTVFMAVSVISAIAFVLFALVFRMPEGESGDMTAGGTFVDGCRMLKNKNIWLLFVVFFAFCGTSMGIANNFYTTFLENVRGFDAAGAASINSLCTLIGLPFQILFGWLTDHVKPRNRRYLLALMCLCMLISFFTMFETGSAATVCMWVFIIMQALGAGFSAGSSRPMAPMLVGGGALGAAMAMAVLQFAQNLGSAVVSPIFGAAVDSMGWQAAGFWVQVPLMVVALVCCFFIVPKGEGKEKRELKED